MKRDHWTESDIQELKSRIDATDLVCGVDEVGRGPLAGPVVACAIIMPKGERIEGVRDSKKVSEIKREKLYDQILEHCIAWGIGQSSEQFIDEINIRQATLRAMKEAVEALTDHQGHHVIPELVVIDAETIDIAYPQIGIIHGDDRIYTISCASIVAKVYRDRQMIALAEKYPEYDLAKNKGYGTKAHMEAIRKFGILPIHRRSFIHEEGLREYQEKHSTSR